MDASVRLVSSLRWGNRDQRSVLTFAVAVLGGGTRTSLQVDVVHHSIFDRATSALGQKRTLSGVRSMSALPLKADIAEHNWNIRFVPDGPYPARQKELVRSRLLRVNARTCAPNRAWHGRSGQG